MSLLRIVALVLAVGVIAFAALALIGSRRLKRIRSTYEGRVAAVGPAELSAKASFFGQASAGKLQMRGLGTLVLTATELVFVQLMPEREVRVVRRSVTSARVTRHFLGKTQGRDLLVVTWDVEGMGDAAAFDTPDIESWRSRLS